MSNPRKRTRQSGSVAAVNGRDQTSVQDADTAQEDGPAPKRRQQRRSLFVRSLPATATTEGLIEHFSQSFPIKHATAVTDATTKTCKGYGFITFADSEDAERAQQEYNGSTFQGRKIKLEMAEPRHREVDDTIPGAKNQKSVPSAVAVEAKAKRESEKADASRPPKLIVRNLPWSIKKPEQLANLFRSYGKVKHATIPSKKPGLLSGFGFVVLRGRKNAEKALAGVNGKEIDGRTLAVDWAVDKETWQGQQEPVNDTEEGSAERGSESSPTVEGFDEELEASDSDENNQEEDEDSGGVELPDEEDEEDAMSDESDVSDHRIQDKSSTLFIRNLPFTSTDESLREQFTPFGAVRYARIVLDPSTERPRGTGFVCFFNVEDARQCLRDAPGVTPIRDPKTKKQTSTPYSLLQSEASDPSGRYTLDGRVLQVCRAVEKSEAARLTDEGVSHRSDRDKDRRRLYLLSEGTISSSSPLYETLSPSEIAMREASAKQRKALIQSNPSLHLSLTRLSIRNIPRSIASKDLKALAREAVVGFAKDVKAEKRQRLSKEELMRGGDAMTDAERGRKAKGKGIVKQAKVVFEGREGGKVTEDSGAGRSRGYGFIEYYSHRSALMGLRWLNGHAVEHRPREAEKGKANREAVKERKKRLIVEFAIENAQVVGRRLERESKAREKPKTEGDEVKHQVVEQMGHSSSKSSTRDRSAKKGAAKSMPTDLNIEKGSEETDKQAKRQRIIARKRAMRRGRKAAA